MMKTALFTTMLAGLLAAVSTASTSAQSQEEASRCVTLRNINGYSVIDDRHVVLHGGVSHYYLVTTRSRCSGLRFGIQVGASFGDHERLCPPIVEHLVTDDGWRCHIATIEEVESEEQARELIESRAQGENSEE